MVQPAAEGYYSDIFTSVKYVLKGEVYHLWEKRTSKARGYGWHYTLRHYRYSQHVGHF